MVMEEACGALFGRGSFIDQADGNSASGVRVAGVITDVELSRCRDTSKHQVSKQQTRQAGVRLCVSYVAQNGHGARLLCDCHVEGTGGQDIQEGLVQGNRQGVTPDLGVFDEENKSEFCKIEAGRGQRTVALLLQARSSPIQKTIVTKRTPHVFIVVYL